MKILILSFSFLLSHSIQANIGIAPMFTYGNFDSFDEITNLSPAGTKLGPDVDDQGRDGYGLVSTKKLYLSFGPQATASIEYAQDQFGYIGLGLHPLYNSYVKHFKKFKNQESFKSFKHDLPLTSEEITNMEVGDATYWNSNGGVVINLIFGVGVVGAGPKVGIEAGHSVYLEKKSPTEVYVELRRIKTKSFGILAGSFVGFAEMSTLSEKTMGMSFLIDVSSSEGMTIFNKLINEGRIDYAQESSIAEVKIGDVTSLKVLNSVKRALSTPFIPLIELKMENGTEVVTEQRENIWNNKGSITRALSLKNRSIRLFGKKIFMETAALVGQEESNTGSSIKAELHWFRKGNRMTIKSLKKSLTKLINQTGMEKELSVTLPEYQLGLGYAKVQFILTPSLTLIKAIQNRLSVSGAKHMAQHFQDYWSNPEKFQKMLALIQKCGGGWQLEVSGEKITYFLRVEDFKATTVCEL